MRVGEISQLCKLHDEASEFDAGGDDTHNLSARAYHRILKLSRMIADLAEALQYRPILML